MARLRHNPNVVYSGRVGARLRMPSGRPTVRKARMEMCEAKDGPLAFSHRFTRRNNHLVPFHGTLTFTLRGETGRYAVGGGWVPQS